MLAYCVDCPMTFATSASLKRHVQTTHQKMSTSSSNDFADMFSHSNDGFSQDTILEIQTFDDVSQISIDASNDIYFKEDTTSSANLCDVIDVRNDDDGNANDVVDVSNDAYILPPSTQFLLRTTSSGEVVKELFTVNELRGAISTR